MDRVVENQPFDSDPDWMPQPIADEMAHEQARAFRRFLIARLAIVLAGAWLLAWPIPLLPHTVFWVLLATMALVIGLTAGPRTHPPSRDTRLTRPR